MERELTRFVRSDAAASERVARQTRRLLTLERSSSELQLVLVQTQGVQPPHDDGVARAQLLEQLVEGGSGLVLAADVVDEDRLTARGGDECVVVQRRVLIGGGLTA